MKNWEKSMEFTGQVDCPVRGLDENKYNGEIWNRRADLDVMYIVAVKMFILGHVNKIACFEKEQYWLVHVIVKINYIYLLIILF